MDKDLVSVIIPNYNYAEYLRDAIESVRSQTYPAIEIIVVDDGSTDGSRDVLGKFGDSITTVFQQNKGVSAARNNGAALAKGEYFAFLDADDLWLPEKVELQVAKFNENAGYGLVHVGLIEIDGNEDEIRRRVDGGEGEVWREMLEFSRQGILGGGSGVMIRRDVFDEVGGFDERLSTSADWDLYYRISRRYAVGFVAAPLLKYRVHNSNMHANIGVMERDMVHAFEKAFNEDSPELGEIKRKAYGSLHQNLAGSYYTVGDYSSFLKHSIRSLASNPRNIRHYLKFPASRSERRNGEG